MLLDENFNLDIEKKTVKNEQLLKEYDRFLKILKKQEQYYKSLLVENEIVQSFYQGKIDKLKVKLNFDI